ncbi:MAG: 50S ribosomal protein L6 [Amoebophilaceae bacterium TMED152]|nr:MAG: 50S ribosomal protein L6 [Amoebophilaceae bacterium TMED152]|tara:strand:+ start:5254 stop:5805 length:552 start_codon:yes stop_codon:yes gene_type:complete
MSRIGLNPINLPEGVIVSVHGSNINVKGPKGELNQKFDPDFKISIDDNILTIKRPSEIKRHKSLHGLYRSLINNCVIGVSEGYELKLELIGVGYKASNQGNLLNLTLGYSHNIYFQVPEEIKITTETQKGKPPVIILNGNDKQLIGQIAAKLKSLRPVEPYKGKGVKFVGEYVRRKVGKTAAA